MKRKFVLIPLTLFALTMSGCNVTSSKGGSKKSSSSDVLTSTTGVSSNSGGSATSTSISIPTSSSSSGWVTPVITDPFSIVNGDGEAAGFELAGSTYTINTSGTYTLSGKLEGRIIINATKNDTIELDLNGVEISSSENSPIFVQKADKVKIKSLEDTVNSIIDSRANKVADADDQYEGAIAAKADLNIIGRGRLQVEGNYNNGIHTSKDLKIKNTELYVYGYQHALRGGNGIEILNNDTKIYAIGKTGDGLKSNDAAVSDKGNQKGTISISGGLVNIHAQCDGIDAAYDVIIQDGTDEDSDEPSSPTVNIYTDKYATLTKAGPGPGWDDSGNSNKSSTTAKGIKAHNAVTVSGGQIYCKCYDDGLHANNEPLTDSDDVETGVNGTGNITISGGNITIDCSDDGMHADATLTISGGNINVLTSFEALEGHDIVISGGTSRVLGTDDGINAGGEENPTITITGGFVEVTVSPSGDTDGIDSNGTYTQTGGIVITKGPNNNNSSALDHEGSATINGGTIIALGAIENQNTRWGGGGGPGGGPGGGEVTYGSNMSQYNLSLHSAGNHTVTIGGVQYSFSNTYSYGRTICYSDTPVSGS